MVEREVEEGGLMPEYVICPKCRRRVLNEASVRQGTVHGANIIDIGFKCPKCRHEWGFEVFKKKVKSLKKVM